MSIDQAIKTYVKFTSKVLSTQQIGGDGKFSMKTFENAIKGIVKDVTENPNEYILDRRASACKV